MSKRTLSRLKNSVKLGLMMSEPAMKRTHLYVVVALFVELIVWAVLAGSVAEYALVKLFTEPLHWPIVASSILAGMTITVSLSAMYLKRQTNFEEPDWEFREREVSLRQFQDIASDYKKDYFQLIPTFNPLLIVLVVIVGSVSVGFPYLLPGMPVIIFRMASALFSAFVLLTGLLVARFVYGLLPSPVSRYFPCPSVDVIRQGVFLLEQTEGLSWIGVSIRIGKADDFYTIRNAHPVGRVEGIEGVAWVSVLNDEKDNPVKIIGELKLPEENVTVSEDIGMNYSQKEVAVVVQELLREYVKRFGNDDVIELLVDLGVRDEIIDEEDES